MSLVVPIARTEQYHAVLMPASNVASVWVFALPFIERALDFAQGELSPSTLLVKAASGTVQVWIIWDPVAKNAVGAATTEVVQYDMVKALRIITMAGESFVNWGDLLYDALLAFAKAEGCSRLEAVGRKGLGRLLAQFGFRPQYVTFLAEVV